MFVAADAQHNHIGLLGDFDCLGDFAAVFVRVAGRNFVLAPRAPAW